MDARGRRGKQIIYEENEEYRGDDIALGYTSIDRVWIKEGALDSSGIPIGRCEFNILSNENCLLFSIGLCPVNK